MTEPEADAVLEALLALGPLDALPRTGWVLRGVPAPESVAGHMLGVAHVALALAPRVEPPLDLGRVLAMAVLHDGPEAISGDLPQPASRHLPAGAKAAMETSIAEEIIAPLSEAAKAAYGEYQSGKTPEARFVKACDTLQMGVRLVAYEAQGHQGLAEFWRSVAGADMEEFPPCRRLQRALVARR